MKQILILTFLLLPVVLQAQSGWRYLGPEAREVHTTSIQGDLIFTSVINPGTGGGYSTLRLFRSTDAGNTWEGIKHEGFLNYPVATIVPGNPDRIFVHLIYSEISKSKTFFISKDNGNSWDSVAIPFQTDKIKRTFVKKDVPGLIFALGETFYSRDRLWRSTDYGYTWTEPFRFAVTSDGADLTIGVSSNSSDMYVNDDTGIAGTYFYHSADNGETWNFVSFGNYYHMWALLVDRDDPSIVYGTLDRMFRSIDGGFIWNNPDISYDPWGFFSILQDENNPELMFVQSFRNSIPRIYLSKDRGITWVLDSTSQDLPRVSDSHTFQMHAFHYDGTKRRIYIGTTRGIYARDLPLTSVENPGADLLPQLQCYPQPARQHISFSAKNLSQSWKSYLRVFNALGKIVHVQTLEKSSMHTWNLSDALGNPVADGLYWVTILSNDRMLIEKFSVRRD